MSETRKSIDSEFFIDCNNLIDGVIGTCKYSHNHFKGCVLAHDNNQFDTSIISAIFCIEESLKGQSLIKHIFADSGITKNEYEILKNHEKKIMSVIDEFTKAYQEVTSGDIGNEQKLFEKTMEYRMNPMSNDEKMKIEKIYRNLPGLRSFFTYTDWNVEKKIWSNVDKSLDNKDQKELSTLLLCFAANFLSNLHMSIIKFVEYVEKSQQDIDRFLHDPNIQSWMSKNADAVKINAQINWTTKMMPRTEKFVEYISSSYNKEFMLWYEEKFDVYYKNYLKIDRDILSIMKKIKPFLRHP